MEEWKILLISTILAIISSYITARFTHKNDVKKQLYEKRTQIYIEFYDKVEELLHNEKLFFEKDYLDMLTKYKPKLKLFSSKATFEAFKSFYLYIGDEYYKYKEFCNHNNPYNDLNNFEIGVDANGEEDRIPHIDEYVIARFDALCLDYFNENLPNSEDINTYLVPLYEAMRKDLGSK